MATIVNDPLGVFCADLAGRFARGERPESVESPFGVHGVDYIDDDGDIYARVGFVLPVGVYGEIDGDTFGTLSALRFPLGVDVAGAGEDR